MTAEQAIGFSIVIVSLLVMGVLVLASRAIVERIHRAGAPSSRDSEESDGDAAGQ